MGSPPSPTLAQIDKLRRAGALPPPENVQLDSDALTLMLPTYGLAVVEFSRPH